MKSPETMKPAKLLRKTVEERLTLLLAELGLFPKHPKRSVKKAAKLLAHIGPDGKDKKEKKSAKKTALTAAGN